jgi:hypothetical protein
MPIIPYDLLWLGLRSIWATGSVRLAADAIGKMRNCGFAVSNPSLDDGNHFPNIDEWQFAVVPLVASFVGAAASFICLGIPDNISNSAFRRWPMYFSGCPIEKRQYMKKYLPEWIHLDVVGMLTPLNGWQLRNPTKIVTLTHHSRYVNLDILTSTSYPNPIDTSTLTAQPRHRNLDIWTWTPQSTHRSSVTTHF